MTRKECLDAAAEAVLTSRAHEYGDGPEDSFSQIAKLWSAYFGIQFTTVDVAMALVMVKMARIRKNPHHNDSYVDGSGYFSCGAECAEKIDDGEYLDYLDGRARAADKPDVWGTFTEELKTKVAVAEKKHPVFADGIPQGVGYISEEVGELNQAVNKNQGREAHPGRKLGCHRDGVPFLERRLEAVTGSGMTRVLPRKWEARQHAGPGTGREQIFEFGCTIQTTGAD